MDRSRRDFTLAAGAAVVLTILGCEKSSDQPADAPARPPVPATGPASRPTGGPGAGAGRRKIPLADKPFNAGPVDQFAAAGVYTQFRDTMGVFLVSDGKELVALNAACTHKGCTTIWIPADKYFNCPCHRSRFDPEGNVIPSKGPAHRPLERLAVTLVAADGAAPDAKPSVVRVDPTKLFHGEKDGWSDPAAALKLG